MRLAANSRTDRGLTPARVTPARCSARDKFIDTAGRPAADSPVVGWLPGHACTNVQVDFCPAANLFCDRTHLSWWRDQAGHPPGRLATLPELATLGAQVWAEMAPPAASGDGRS
ncbi:MAG: organomercurial lyase [Actinomycetota bacterium]|nr:organomercurial lyase [Actinomycetota bacterium]